MRVLSGEALRGNDLEAVKREVALRAYRSLAGQIYPSGRASIRARRGPRTTGRGGVHSHGTVSMRSKRAAVVWGGAGEPPVGIQGPLLLGPLRSFHSSIRSHRQAREAQRTGTPAENLTVLPETLRHAFDAIAAESVLSLRFPVALGWTPPPLAPLTWLLCWPRSACSPPARESATPFCRIGVTVNAEPIRLEKSKTTFGVTSTVRGPRCGCREVMGSGGPLA